MRTARLRMAAMVLLAGLSAAVAGPNISPSELPGRERERFRESPVDRFMQPNPSDRPLWVTPEVRRPCQAPPGRRSKSGAARNKTQ
jgi:hypothetical protein